MPLNEQRDFCINNSVSSLDLWNNRYLHLESSDGYYEINPKNTIILRFLRNRKVSAKRESFFHCVIILEEITMYHYFQLILGCIFPVVSRFIICHLILSRFQ